MKKEFYHVVSNTHWDREWYQSHEKYLVRLVELMDRLIDIMEAKPEYRFVTDGQYALVEDYLAAKPQNTERIKKLVSDGRLLIGPWYTQPLENIVGGEALIRNLQKGIADSEKLGGAMRFSYEIDEFGHTSQLPQILAGFGINSIMAWRGVPNFCRSYFKWNAPDGTVAHFFNSNAGYGEATSLPDSVEDFTETIDGISLKRDGLNARVKKIRELRLKVSDSSHMLWLNGIDHSWAQEDILEICEKIEALYPDFEVKQSTPAEYAEAVINDLKANGKEPESFGGELLFTNELILESVNALHPRQKRRHFESEKLLTGKAEPLTEFASLFGFKYPEWAIEREWKYVLENHAHDSLGCCSVDEVFEQVMARYGASISIGEQLCDDSLRKIMTLGEDKPSLWLFNLSEKDVKGSVKASFDIPAGFGGENIILKTADGKAAEMSIISVNTNGDVRYNPKLGHPTWGEVAHYEAIIDAPLIPAYGAVRLSVEQPERSGYPRNRQDSFLCKTPYSMENDNLRIEFAENGTFTLTDKRNGAVYPEQLLFTDDGEAGDCYVHIEPKNDMRRYSSKGSRADICILYDTPLGAAFEVKLNMEIPCGISKDRKMRTQETEKLKIVSVVSLEKDSESVSIDIKLDNKCKNHRVRALFPSYVNSEYSFADQAFDTVKRKINIPDDKSITERPYLTQPMLSFCGIAEKGKGLAAAARGIFEYECTNDGMHALALTLLRSVEVIDNFTFEKTPEYFMEQAQNICEISHSLTLIPYDGSEKSLYKEVSRAVNSPFALANRTPEESVMPDYRRPENKLGDCFKAIEISNDDFALTAFKKAYKTDSLIIRILNRSYSEKTGKIKLNIPAGFKEIYLCDLEENRLEKIGFGSEAEIFANGKKIVTLEFTV